LSAIVYQVVEGTMTIVWIAPGADLHGFQAEGGDFIQHGVEGEMVVNGIEHADRDFVQVASWLCRRSAGNWILGICRVCQHLTAGNRSRQQTTRGSQKLPPADGGVLRLLLHASPRTPGGFRRYGENEVETLAFIRRVQGLGFRLSQIRALLRLRANRLQPCAPVQRRLQEKLTDVRQKLADLHGLENELRLAL